MHYEMSCLAAKHKNNCQLNLLISYFIVGREKMMTQEKILFNEMMTRSDVGCVWSQ